MLRWQDSVLGRREVSPQELDYRVATDGFENCGPFRIPGEGGVTGWSVIDFAYDTDWTGLRNWTGFLPGLASLLVARFFPSVFLLSFPPSSLFLSLCFSLLSFSFYRASVIRSRTLNSYTLYVSMHVTRIYSHITVRISTRDGEGFPLISFAGNVEGDWPRTSDLCDLRGCIYEHSDRPCLNFHIALTILVDRLILYEIV